MAYIGPLGHMHEFTPTVPKLYWDVDSQEQRIKAICCQLRKLVEYSDQQTEQINANAEDIEELENLFEKFRESGFEDYYAEQVAHWIDEHLTYVYDKTIKQIYFGLTDDGHFCAYVPENWKDIRFDTGMVWGRSDYGRLILRYDVEGQGVIDNTYEYTLNEPDTAKIVADLETVANVKRIPLVNATPAMFDIEDGSYIQNGYIVTVDCQVFTKQAVSQSDVMVSNLPEGDTLFSSFSCIDGEGKQRSIYVDGATLCIGDDDVPAGVTLFINGTYFAKYSNIQEV